MENIDLNNECVYGIPVDIQLHLCKEAARAFGYLCKTVCEKFGHEGEKIIRETFLSDSDLFKRDVPLGEENSSKEVGMTLIKLLASWGISSSSYTK